MIVTNRKDRVYEIKAFHDYLNNPCKTCGIILTESNQSKGWRGMCKMCRQDRQVVNNLYTCVICSSSTTPRSYEGRCPSCESAYQQHLAVI